MDYRGEIVEKHLWRAWIYIYIFPLLWFAAYTNNFNEAFKMESFHCFLQFFFFRSHLDCKFWRQHIRLESVCDDTLFDCVVIHWCCELNIDRKKIYIYTEKKKKKQRVISKVNPKEKKMLSEFWQSSQRLFSSVWHLKNRTDGGNWTGRKWFSMPANGELPVQHQHSSGRTMPSTSTYVACSLI